MSVSEGLADLVEDALGDAGKLGSAYQEIKALAAGQMAYLATITGQPGFYLAVRASANTLALKIAIHTVEEGDRIDARLIGLLEGGLAIGARALLGGLPA